MKFAGNQSTQLLLIAKENILENASAYVFIAALAGFSAWSIVLVAHIAILYTGSIIACACLCLQFMSTQQQSPAFAEHRQRDFSVAWLFIFIWVGYLIWLKTFAIYRYLIYIERLSPIALRCADWMFRQVKGISGISGGGITIDGVFGASPSMGAFALGE